jgi:hypothetical protein
MTQNKEKRYTNKSLAVWGKRVKSRKKQNIVYEIKGEEEENESIKEKEKRNASGYSYPRMSKKEKEKINKDMCTIDWWC